MMTASNKVLDFAVGYADRGFKVVVIPPKSKGPVERDWGKKATDDPEKLEEQVGPTNNIGVLLGPESGIIDVEADSPEAELICQKVFGEVYTPTYQSTKGKHRLFRWHPDFSVLDKAVVRVGLRDDGSLELVKQGGLEIRLGGLGKQTQSVFPPSIHPDSGKTYRWLEGLSLDNEPIAEFPDGVVAEIVALAMTGDTSNGNGRFELTVSIPKGSRNDNLYRFACSHRAKGLDYEEILPSVNAVNVKRCNPPLSDWEVADIVRSACRHEQGKLNGTGRRVYHLTDIGNAERFRDQHQDKARYCHPWKCWIVWDETRWQRDDSGAAVRLAKETVRAIYAELNDVADDSRRQALAKHAIKSESKERVKAMLELARSELAIQPEELDSDPWLLNCPNGTIELRTGELREHRQEDFITKICPTEYRPDAESKLWKKFLSEVFDNDTELIGFIQKFFGHCLTGDVSEQLLPIFWGDGANGKTTLLNAFTDTVGDDFCWQAPHDFLTTKKNEIHPTDRAELQGRRFASCSETDNGRKLAESLVKTLTGGDKVTARKMYQDNSTFKATHKLVLSTNHRPVITGDDHAIWRRLPLVPFNATFDVETADKQLPEKLKAEAPSILAWAVRGCLAWQADGMALPSSVVTATHAYRTGRHGIDDFIAERCTTHSTHSIKASDLFHNYREWCDGAEQKPATQTKFGRELAERGYDDDKTGGVVFRTGITLREPQQDSLDS